MRKSSLYIGLPLPSIPSELPPSPCAEKVSAFSDIVIYTNTIPEISNDYNGFTTSENALYVHFPRHGDKRSAARDERIRRTGVAGDRGKPE